MAIATTPPRTKDDDADAVNSRNYDNSEYDTDDNDNNSDATG